MARLARELGVHRSTVCRDFQAFRRVAADGRVLREGRLLWGR
jgi:hypothetical protein